MRLDSIKKKNLLYVGANTGFTGTAMAVHSRNIAKIFMECGYDVSYLCQNIPPVERQFSQEEGYTYIRQYITIPKFSVLENISEEIWGLKMMRLFRKSVKESKPDLVISYGSTCQMQMIKFCRKHEIPIYADATDWFEITDRNDSVLNRIFQFCGDRVIEKANLMANGVISISQFFHQYYLDRGQKSFWLPPVFELPPKTIFRREPGSPVRLVYAGSLGGNKDTVAPVIQCFLEETAEWMNRFELNLVGIEEADLNQSFGKHDWKEHRIHAWGRLPHENTLRMVENSDFCILLRQNKRYAKAGFSTKFAESMSQGVPMLCTAVGGADMLIQDMKNGVLVPDNRYETIKEALIQISELPNEKLIQMKQNAYDTAEKYFDYHNYTDSIKKFIEETDCKNDRK